MAKSLSVFILRKFCKTSLDNSSTGSQVTGISQEEMQHSYHIFLVCKLSIISSASCKCCETQQINSGIKKKKKRSKTNFEQRSDESYHIRGGRCYLCFIITTLCSALKLRVQSPLTTEDSMKSSD